MPQKNSVGFKMASVSQDGGQYSKKNNVGTIQHFCVLVLRLVFRQEHESRAYFVILVKTDGSIQNGGSKLDFLHNSENFQYFQSFFAFIWC
jgi:hypothetical protein